MAEMGMVAGGQHGGDRRGDRCGDQRGDWHRNWRLVGLVVLTWWSVFGFGGRRLVGWVAMGLLGFQWVLGGFYFFFYFFFNFGFLVLVGFCWAKGSGGVVAWW